MLAGEVLFAEVLVTPTGVSKGCGYVILVYPLYGLLTSLSRIVEFASPEDAQRSVRELSEQSLLGRPVFIREVRTLAISVACSTNQHPSQDRENESRFGATPVPGKMGMAMAGQGMNAGPPPRPSAHNQAAGSPGNQLYVGNVSTSTLIVLSAAYVPFSYPIKPAGKT